jgi:hypothetical protein
MDQVGPFRLGRVLGSGGQGVVRSAVHEGTGTAVAVKLTTADGEAARRIREEVSVLADLDHPNVVRLWGAGVTDGRAWFAMELARTTLAAEPPSDWSTTRAVLRHILSALGHVHARDLLHLDVKPANVLLGCEDGSDELGPVPGLRLSDFGVGGGRGGPVTGTPGYAPPEQLRGAWREIGPVSDLFALGETTWRWVTGRPRFAGTPAEILRAQLRDAPTPFVPRFPVPPSLEEWLRWLLDPRPTARPQRAVEALDALPGEVVDRSVTVPPALSAEPTWMGDAPLDEPSVELSRALASRPASPTRGWQVPEPWSRVRWLADGGLGPVTSRLPRFVGRVDHRDRLWSALQRVRASGAPGVVRIRGVCPGAGASRLASWFGGRIHETDQGVVLRYQPGDDLASMLRREARADGLSGLALIDRMRSAGRGWGFPDDVASALGEVVADGADPVALATRIPAGRPLVLIHDLPGYQEAWSPLLAPVLAEPLAAVLVVFVTDRDDLPGEVIEVGPLTLGEGDALLDRWLGLSRALADELFVASGGVPGAMFRWLRALDERGELRAGPAGFVATGPLPELLPAGGMPADPVSWLDAVARGEVADPVFRAAVLRSVPPEVASAAWARAAELPATSASTAALRRGTRSGPRRTCRRRSTGGSSRRRTPSRCRSRRRTATTRRGGSSGSGWPRTGASATPSTASTARWPWPGPAGGPRPRPRSSRSRPGGRCRRIAVAPSRRRPRRCACSPKRAATTASGAPGDSSPRTRSILGCAPRGSRRTSPIPGTGCGRSSGWRGSTPRGGRRRWPRRSRAPRRGSRPSRTCCGPRLPRWPASTTRPTRCSSGPRGATGRAWT